MTSQSARKVVVLGAGGFLGGALASYLAKAGHQTLACSRKRITEIEPSSNLTLACGDIRSKEFLGSVFRGADVVFHFATSTYPSLNYANPKAEYEEALAPLFDLIEVAELTKVKKIVFPSSGGTIYAPQLAPRTEETLANPQSPYAIFKLAAESLLMHAAIQGKFSADIFRIANPYGPGQRRRPGQGVIPHWIESMSRKLPVTIFGDGNARRDYVYIDDMCHLVSLSLNRLEQTDIFNLGTGIATSLTELLNLLRSVAETSIGVKYDSSRPVDLSSVSLDSSKLLKLVPEFRFTELADGLAKTLDTSGLSSRSIIPTQSIASVQRR